MKLQEVSVIIAAVSATITVIQFGITIADRLGERKRKARHRR